MTTHNPNHPRRWAILAILGVAQLMVVLDATIVMIALPSAQRALHFTTANRQWIVTAYALAFGSLLLLGGRLSDLFGRKWTLIAGLSGFAIASAVAGAAQSFAMLAVARAFQGAFGALLAPSALSLLTTTFNDPSERAKAFGVFSAIAGAGASIGLLLGGILTQSLSWRFSMYVNLVFALVAVAGTLALVHNSRPQTRPRLDIPGALAVSCGLFALVFGFSHAQTASWGSHLTIGLLVTGVLLVSLFVAQEARAKNPLLPLRVLAHRNRGGSFLAIGISGAAIFGVFLFLTYYLQDLRGFSPITTGLAFLPMSVTIMGSAILGQTKLQARYGERRLVVTGMTFGALGLLYLTRIGLSSSYAVGILPSLVATGIGLGLVISTSISSATLGVEPNDAGVASASVSASQQVGASLGTALLSTIAASAVTHYLAGGHHIPGLTAHATVHGYSVGFAWAAAIFAVGAIASAALFTAPERGAAPSTPDDVQIRRARQEDDAALDRLAALDSGVVPAPPVLVAEVDRELRAALSLASYDVIADPFHGTDGIVELLRKQAAPLPRQHVVIVGGGFGGLQAASRLARLPIDVTLIDRRNFHLFQPLAYQVATGALSPAEICYPLRRIFRSRLNVRIVLAEAYDIDLDARRVKLNPVTGEHAPDSVEYDTLIVSAGAEYNYFGHDEWRAPAADLKTIEGALMLRRRLLAAFEAAELEPDAERRSAWLTFVVVGGGPTGVEMAGQIAEIARDLRSDFRSFDISEARILLVEPGDRVLSAFPASLSARALRSLERLGVEALLGHRVTDLDHRSVTLQGPNHAPQRIPARTVIWAAGVIAPRLARVLAERAGLEIDRAGRLEVSEDLSLPGHPEVLAIGDMVRIRQGDGTTITLSGLAPVAMQEGRHAAGVVRDRMHGRAAKRFRYHDKGNLATIGRASAVAEIKGVRLAGFAAWVTWLTVHLWYLIGFENRLLVLIRWAFSFITRGRGARLITSQSERSPTAATARRAA